MNSKRIGFVFAALAAAMAVIPRPASAALMGAPLLGGSDWPVGPLVGLGVFAGAPTNSYTRVREDADRGTYLYLEDDLGVPVIGEAQIQLGWRFDPDDALGLAIGYIFIGGGQRTHADDHYNATTIAAGTFLGEDPTSVHWFVIELQYERALFRFMEADRGLLAIDLGIRYDDLDWRFSPRTIAATSAGAEAGEDFRTQSIPIPVVGLTARFPIAPEWDVVASARGFRLNHISSGRLEGGLVYTSESFIDATLGLAFRAAESVQIAFGYRFLYVDIDEESREDGNLIGVFSHGAYFTVQATF